MEKVHASILGKQYRAAFAFEGDVFYIKVNENVHTKEKYASVVSLRIHRISELRTVMCFGCVLICIWDTIQQVLMT